MPEQDYTDRLKDYVQVKDRIVALYELFGTARIETAYELTTEPDDKPKVICRALVYRTPDDQHPSTGTSWLYLPGTTPYTKGSEIENAETSAIGRAIGFLGILIDKSIASANEIAGKQSEPDVRAEITTDGGLIGTAEKGTSRTSDYLLRETPTGHFLGFRLKGGGRKAGVLVEAHNEMAVALATVESAIIGQRLQVWGKFVTHELRQGGAYQALLLERLVAPELTLPAAPDQGSAPSTPLEQAGTNDAGLVPDAAGPASGKGKRLGADSDATAAAATHPAAATAGQGGPVLPPETAEVSPLPGGEAGVEAASMSEAAPLCLNKGSLDTVCNLEKGHAGKHKELATDGRVLAAW